MSETDYAHHYARPLAATSSITLRTPNTADGVAVWRAVQNTGTLEPNTAYFYLIFCSDFRHTCLIAEDGNEIAGVLIGYHPPSQPDTAFCWQIGVLAQWRGQGLGKRLLSAWLDLPANRHVRWLTATVADDNQASDKLFRGFAESMGMSCTVSPRFISDHFPAGHRPEPIYRIGPIRSGARTRA
ncbi:MAG: diaminobutyrate acetyltransferase [Burkholderiaceae bacterium]|nr:diaminobutyrate acetyltransferase [Burkholderiaceae bacterium]MCD8518078.1 diaminobutyrate acetyltransferase [Burkholderiaceae bacterium]MCD8537014.1 diaminobutyrate acetyltransferase [Burkholderiaceae bacterium]MCD8565120.1 diaminobutyrate acetyltransferase [Burkholderiaceae bacterium]